MSYFVFFVSCSGAITSVGEERANVSAIVYFRRGFVLLLVLGMGCVTLLYYSMGLSYNYLTKTIARKKLSNNIITIGITSMANFIQVYFFKTTEILATPRKINVSQHILTTRATKMIEMMFREKMLFFFF